MKDLKKLFSVNTSKTNVATISQQNFQSPDAIRSGESYVSYGKRVCGMSNGSPLCLSPFLQRIFTSEKQKQLDDKVFQESEREKRLSELNQLQKEISDKKADVQLLVNKINQTQDKINDYKSEIDNLKATNGAVNKEAKVKFLIGFIILFIMTIYLFIFYSSTFYSAFFKDFLTSDDTSIGQAIFDAQAIPKSLSAGFGQMLFVISAPIIFLGLGFALHYFSQENGKLKYIKILAIILVTFIFDCILAYSIAHKMHELMSLISLEPITQYTIKDALYDSNVWAVIFCGFVVYVIWGIVFSLTMSAYENIRSNKEAIVSIQGKLNSESTKLATLQNDKIIADNQLQSLQNTLANRREQLMSNVTIKYSDIKVALNDFFTGWTSLLVPLGKSTEDITKTNKVYQDTVSALIPVES